MTGSRLDPWIDSYAQRANGMTASEIRALFAVASRPEVVSLAGGMPYVEALPMEAIAGTVAHLLATRGTAALQYGNGQGDQSLREQITEVMAPVGVHAHPDDIVVTAGSQMALDLVTRIFCDPATWYWSKPRPTSVRWGSSAPTRSMCGTWPWMTRGWSPRR